jgi:hypothetical protein
MKAELPQSPAPRAPRHKSSEGYSITLPTGEPDDSLTADCPQGEI